MLRFLKICFILLVSSLHLFGCGHLTDLSDETESVETGPKIVVKPRPSDIVESDYEEEPVEVVVDDSPDEFIKALYEARLNLALYDRTKAQDAIQKAFDEAKKVNFENDGSLKLLQIDFAKEGFAKTTSYLVLQEESEGQINDLIANLAMNNQKLLSISIVKPNNSVISDAVLAHVETALDAIKNINPETPDYDFNIADKKIIKTYESWKTTPYDKDVKFEAAYYLDVTESLLNNQKYDVAKIVLGKAKESYKSFSANKRNKLQNPEFVSSYKIKLSSIETRLRSSKKSIIDYLF